MTIICPHCKEGELYIYREILVSQFIPLTTRNTPSKRKLDNIRHEKDENDYLRCRKCPITYDYEMDEKGQVIKSTITEWSY